jgi:deazaflavin-dependent oxidoreductase (nitroreductase family)
MGVTVMNPRFGQDTSPRRSAPRWLTRVFAVPSLLYRYRCGWLLGHRFIQLDHVGRRSGQVHHTVLEVLDRHRDTGQVTVMSGFGPKADWLQNIRAGGPVRIHIAHTTFSAQAAIVPPEEAHSLLAAYERRNRFAAPLVRAVLSRLLGWHYDGSPRSRRRAVQQLPVVRFTPNTH